MEFLSSIGKLLTGDTKPQVAPPPATCPEPSTQGSSAASGQGQAGGSSGVGGYGQTPSGQVVWCDSPQGTNPNPD